MRGRWMSGGPHPRGAAGPHRLSCLTGRVLTRHPRKATRQVCQRPAAQSNPVRATDPGRPPPGRRRDPGRVDTLAWGRAVGPDAFAAGPTFTSPQDLGDLARADGAATLADGETEALLHGDRLDQLNSHLGVVARHDHLGALGQRDDAGDVGGPEVELRTVVPVSYTHLRAHETRHDLVCRLLLEK